MMRKIPIPKLQVNIARLDDIFPSLHYFLNPPKGRWGWSQVIYRFYPKLAVVLRTTKDNKERKKAEYYFFTQVLKENKSALIKKKENFQKEWKVINDKIMLTLAELVEYKWPKKDKFILARLSLNPICPRYLQQRTFDVFYRWETRRMKAMAIHEIFHFIYFEKWKSVFPETLPKEFESPHLIWHFSEMVIGVVLNDQRLQNIFEYPFHSYREYRQMTINGAPLLSYLKNFYDRRKSFADFLIQSWQFVDQHRKRILAV